MSCVARTLIYISDGAGFDGEEYLENQGQVGAYCVIMESIRTGQKRWV
jgi:hypothetical protein